MHTSTVHFCHGCCCHGKRRTHKLSRGPLIAGFQKMVLSPKIAPETGPSDRGLASLSLSMGLPHTNSDGHEIDRANAFLHDHRDV